MHRILIHGVFAGCLSVVHILGVSSAHAASITLSDPYQWLENRSTNTLGSTPGLRQIIGINSVLPNGVNGTTGTATQGNTVLPLGFSGTSAVPNEFSANIAANPALYGAWQLAFTNGANTATISTPAINPALTPMPFVNNVNLVNNSSTSSTFSWSIPTGASVDAVRFNLYDHGRLNLAGTAVDDVYNATFGPTTTSLTLPSVLPATALPLVNGHLYTLEISLLDFSTNTSNGAQSDLRNRSRLFVDFLPGITPATGAYLPVVVPGVGGAPPIFQFNISNVGSNVVYIDPAVATGYSFQTGVGDPNFASVILPTGIGSGHYQVVLADGSSFDVLGGQTFAFAAGGVSSFKVTGIDAAAGLDPNDPSAFITGLTFEQNGAFTGTMQAIVAVPEPSTWALLLAGAGVVALRSRRRRSAARG